MTDDVRKQHEELTQQYATWGDKLLQHADVLNSIQNERMFKPITVQLSLCEACDSDCPFCSVACRPTASKIPWDTLVKVLTDFHDLGAKSVEITGGGNPLLYKHSGHDVNDVIRLCASLGYDIGIITNSHDLSRVSPMRYDEINWIRISLIKLDEGIEPEDYDFRGFPYEKLGFSYIIYDECTGSPKRNRYYEGTSRETIEKIARLVELYDGKIKFVRFAGDCLVKGNNALVRQRFEDVVNGNDRYKKFFIKAIDNDDDPFEHGCYVGMVRPYVAPSPKGNDYMVYTCTSHVLEKRTYDLDFALCRAWDVKDAWTEMNWRYSTKGYPYEVRCNRGRCWTKSCKFCYYKFNNRLLHTVAQEMPDKNFP